MQFILIYLITRFICLRALIIYILYNNEVYFVVDLTLIGGVYYYCKNDWWQANRTRSKVLMITKSGLGRELILHYDIIDNTQ